MCSTSLYANARCNSNFPISIISHFIYDNQNKYPSVLEPFSHSNPREKNGRLHSPHLIPVGKFVFIKPLLKCLHINAFNTYTYKLGPALEWTVFINWVKIEFTVHVSEYLHTNLSNLWPCCSGENKILLYNFMKLQLFFKHNKKIFSYNFGKFWLCCFNILVYTCFFKASLILSPTSL